MQIMTAKATTRSMAALGQRVLNSLMFPQIFLHAQHFLPDKFFP